jgi:hypothetical protein
MSTARAPQEIPIGLKKPDPPPAPPPITPSVSARLAQIERTARTQQYVHKETVLWLITELRKSMSQLMVIDSKVREICTGIDSVLEKVKAP